MLLTIRTRCMVLFARIADEQIVDVGAVLNLIEKGALSMPYRLLQFH
jgi:hypothetical protein